MTTRVIIDPPGNCGFRTVVEAIELSAGRIRVDIISECQMLRGMGSGLREIEWKNAVRPLASSIIHGSPAMYQTRCCPVLVAIPKAIEAEVGVALSMDISIRFETPDRKGQSSSSGLL